ncbi:GntR family transcriptional regulator [Ottowia caeni]|uniref:GntR family transcriptional regulator n=1 Tax=Ottowia caeni TaxID=2870339 RepID=UPI001E4DE5A2|nr:GntR family transcriptional regulator [Ottowia caeni]
MELPIETIASELTQGATLASTVFERLREDILEGRFQPGERLRISVLEERYQVGSSPIREALNRLMSISLVQQVDRRGFRVLALGTEDQMELSRTRCWVNEIVIRESVAHGDDAWEEAIVLAFHRFWRCPMLLPGGQVSREWELLHRRFHASLIAACPSKYMRDFHELLFDRADWARRASAQWIDPEASIAEHRAIMDAVLSRDAALAISLLNKAIELLAEGSSEHTSVLQGNQIRCPIGAA